MKGEIILVGVAIAYSAALTAVGRRLPGPASIAAYVTAVAALVAIPLLPDSTARLIDRLVPIAGVGRLLVHLSFMTLLSAYYLTTVLATNRWSWRKRPAIGGSAVLAALFLFLWLGVQMQHLPDMAALFYGIRAGRPSLIMWMNVVMGAGIVYIAIWTLAEYHYFLRTARKGHEQTVAFVSVVLYSLAGVSGTLTIVEAVARNRGLNMAVVQHFKTPLTASVLTVSAIVLVGQVWLWPLWTNRRQIALRYVAPEYTQLRNDLLNLNAVEAERRLDMHNESYANRAIVEDVAARCRSAGISRGRCAIARMATSIITFDRDNVIQDPSYGLTASWDELTKEAATEIDERMAATAWEEAKHLDYISQQVYIIVFLVLDHAGYRETLLVDERPRFQPWHCTIAEIIATVMHEHGQTTPLYAKLAQRPTRERVVTRAWAKLMHRRGRRLRGLGMTSTDGVHEGYGEPTR